MFHSWSSANKITDTALQVQYTSSLLGYNPWIVSYVYEYHRLATKSYRYFGMDEATAKACQAAKLAQYCRTLRQQGVTSLGNIYYRRVNVMSASVAMRYDEADLWTVEIEVSEDQMQVYPRYFNDIASAGIFDEGLDYDEDAVLGACLQATSAYFESARLKVAYVHAGPDFVLEDVVGQQSADGVTWTDMVASSASDGLISFAASSVTGPFVRLRLATGSGVISNVMNISDEHVYTDVITARNVSFRNGSWQFGYTADIRDFRKEGLCVYSRTDAAGEWTNITDQCAVWKGLVVTPMADADGMYQFYVDYGIIASNVVTTPYNPSADVGDGSLKLLCCGSDGVKWYATLDTSGIDDFDAAKVTAKVSQEGMSWTALTLSAETAASGAICRSFTTDDASAPRYVKFFYDGVQATTAIVLPYPSFDTDVVRNLGITLGNGVLTRIGFAGAEDTSLLSVEVSSDGGQTWTTPAGSVFAVAGTGYYQLTDGFAASDVRSIRLRYNGLSTLSYGWPLA